MSFLCVFVCGMGWGEVDVMITVGLRVRGTRGFLFTVLTRVFCDNTPGSVRLLAMGIESCYVQRSGCENTMRRIQLDRLQD